MQLPHARRRFSVNKETWGGRNELVARAVPDLGRRLSLIGERTARFLSLRETVLVMREEVPKADVERLYSIAAAFPN